MISPEYYTCQQKYALQLTCGVRVVAYYQGWYQTLIAGRWRIVLLFTKRKRSDSDVLYCGPPCFIKDAENG